MPKPNVVSLLTGQWPCMRWDTAAMHKRRQPLSISRNKVGQISAELPDEAVAHPGRPSARIIVGWNNGIHQRFQDA